MIVQNEEGRSDFVAFQSELQSGRSVRLDYCVFDLIELNGEDLRQRPLQERRERLRELVGPHDPDKRIQFSQSLVGSATDMLQAGCAMGVEGIVSKRLADQPGLAETKG